MHFRETLTGLSVETSRRIDAHLMCIYATLGEAQLQEVARVRHFASSAPTAEVFITAGTLCLDYDVMLEDAAGYLVRAIDLIRAAEKGTEPSGNPTFWNSACLSTSVS